MLTDSIFRPWIGLAGITVAVGLAGCSSSSDKNGASASGDGGASDATSGDDGGACVSGDTKACTTFTTPTGTVIQLGPYGAQMDPNVGTGFENAIAAQDEPDASFCQGFAADFKQNAALTSDLLNTNQDGINLNFALYTVYRPVTWPAGPIPVITWGNGTCAQPEGYGALLRYVASYGFFVVAANSREVSDGTVMLHALDYAAAANMDPTSPYYQKLDLTRIGAMGHSQGGGAAQSAAKDSRVKSAVIFNAADTCTKPFFALSGDMDITGFTPAGMASAVNGAPAPGAWLYFHMVPDTGNLNGHLTLMLQPDRVTGPTVDWWKMVFEDDADATKEFVGSDCGLCNDTADHEFGEHGLPLTSAEAGAPEAGPSGEGGSPEAGSTSPEAGPSDAGSTPDTGTTPDDAGAADAGASAD